MNNTIITLEDTITVILMLWKSATDLDEIERVEAKRRVNEAEYLRRVDELVPLEELRILPLALFSLSRLLRYRSRYSSNCTT